MAWNRPPIYSAYWQALNLAWYRAGTSRHRSNHRESLRPRLSQGVKILIGMRFVKMDFAV